MSIQILDNSGQINGLVVNASGEAAIAPTQDVDRVGLVGIAAESNPDEGFGRRVRALEASSDYRLRIGMDSFLYKDNFSHAQINTSKYKVVNTTMTNALSGGRWILNSGSSVGSGVGTQFQTWTTFCLSLSGTLYCDFAAGILVAPQTNNVCEFGLFYPTGVAVPGDGVYFRLNASAAWEGVINSASTETTVALLGANGSALSIVSGEIHHFLIGIHNDITDFWVDDLLVGSINTPVALGSPFRSMSAPLAARIYNSGVVSIAQQLLVANVSVTSGDVDANRLWPTMQGVMGNSAVNIPDGTAPGQTSNIVLSTAPVTVAAASQLSTIACYTTLGGQFALGTIASAETEVLVFDYTNPAGTNAIPGKNLIIRGVTIDTVNLGAVGSALGVVQQWILGVGGTTSTLAAVDSATAGTRAFRKVALGFTTFPASAAIGAQCQNPVDINLDAPIVCEPGCHVAVIMKPISGPSNAGQITRGTCFVNGYFE